VIVVDKKHVLACLYEVVGVRPEKI